MPFEVTLFDFKNEGIHITITARFEGEDLIVEGYDIGKTVEESWGDSDYEYSRTVRMEHIPKLCELLQCDPTDKEAILNEVAKRFNGNYSYSEFTDFLTEHGIENEGFTWA